MSFNLIILCINIGYHRTILVSNFTEFVWIHGKPKSKFDNQKMTAMQEDERGWRDDLSITVYK